MTYTSALPSYSPVKAMSEPSCENLGNVSSPSCIVSRVATPPWTGAIQMSSPATKTTLVSVNVGKAHEEVVLRILSEARGRAGQHEDRREADRAERSAEPGDSRGEQGRHTDLLSGFLEAMEWAIRDRLAETIRNPGGCQDCEAARRRHPRSAPADSPSRRRRLPWDTGTAPSAAWSGTRTRCSGRRPCR